MATLPALFAETAARAGEAVLVRTPDATLTVRDVDERSDALAVALAERGVGRGDRVALHLQNDPEYLLALLAAWKLGAIAVACSPMLRGHELAAQLRDAGAATYVGLESLHAEVAAPVLAETPVRTVLTEHDVRALARDGAGRSPDPVALADDDVAVLTYTSGTTGPPKGAMNTHGNVVHGARAYAAVARLGPSDVVLGIAPLFHVTGLVAHLAVALLVPMPLVLLHRFDALETCRAIERHRPTFTVAAVTAYTALLAAPGEHDLSSLTKAYSGGAAVAPASAAAWERRTGTLLHTVYGLTETTSPSHMTPLGERPRVDPASGALSVGPPVPGTEARIVDPAGRTLGPGEPGEIAIRGPQVVPGYWRRPQESAAALPGGELRTGDVGVVDADGWFFVVDRLKDLINASGFKVWPRDVEDVLHAHPAVREAAVVGVPDAYRGEAVKAFVALHDGAEAAPAELVAFARERLAAYKYPRDVVVLDALPRTASGKVLRRELRGR